MELVLSLIKSIEDFGELEGFKEYLDSYEVSLEPNPEALRAYRDNLLSLSKGKQRRLLERFFNAQDVNESSIKVCSLCGLHWLNDVPHWSYRCTPTTNEAVFEKICHAAKSRDGKTCANPLQDN